MAKNKHRQPAIVRRLKGPRRSRTRIGLRAPFLFAAIVIIAMAMDTCAFPPSRRNVVLAEVCVPARPQLARERAKDRAAPAPVEKVEACQ